jgi:histidine racemase
MYSQEIDSRTNQRKDILMKPVSEFELAVLRPGGNDTCLVLGLIDDPQKAQALNAAIMEKYPNVEQGGSVDLTPGSVELRMFGGEFCGNATRITAWLALQGKPGTIDIKVSGVANTLKAGVTENGEAFAQMPVYADVSRIQADGTDLIVEMEGITQVITYDIEQIKDRSPEEIKQIAMARIRELGLDTQPAAGIIYTEKRGDTYAITPVVYVRDIDTLFLETACGSGTTALGMTIALATGESISNVAVLQPSGLPIRVSVAFNGKEFGIAQICGPIEILEPFSKQKLKLASVPEEKL